MGLHFTRSPQASHVASVPRGEDWRYFTFERPMLEELGPILGEVEAGGTHVNLGGHPGPATGEAFCERLSEVLGVPVRISDGPRPMTLLTRPVRRPGDDPRLVAGLIGVILVLSLGGLLALRWL